MCVCEKDEALRERKNNRTYSLFKTVPTIKFGFLGSARRAVTKLFSWARTARGVSPGFPKCDRLLPAQKILFLYDCNVGSSSWKSAITPPGNEETTQWFMHMSFRIESPTTAAWISSSLAKLLCKNSIVPRSFSRFTLFYLVVAPVKIKALVGSYLVLWTNVDPMRKSICILE